MGGDIQAASQEEKTSLRFQLGAAVHVLLSQPVKDTLRSESVSVLQAPTLLSEK